MKTLTASSNLPRLRRASPGVLEFWHLLSLDAPTVAAVWTVFVARAAHVDLPACVPAAMFVAVWAIYGADRLLDARRQEGLEARHRFHGRHRLGFCVALGLACCALVPLIAAFPAAMIRLYAELGGLLLVWLGVVHRAPRMAGRRPIPKEMVVGVFFSAAVFVPVLALARSAGLLAPALAMGNLCSLNCLFIYAWEHPVRGDGAHASTRFGLRKLREIAVGSVILPMAAALFAGVGTGAILIAASLAAAALLLLDRMRGQMGRVTLRAAADAALLTPLLLLALLK